MKNFNGLLKDWEIEEILESFEIKSGVYKLVTERSSYILKKKKNKEIIVLEHRMLSYLKTKDIPASAPLKSINGVLWLEIHDELYAVYKFVEGESILYSYDKDNSDIIYEYGKVLGGLHKALKGYTPLDKVHEMDILKELFTSTIPAIEKNISIDRVEKFKSTINSIKDNMVSIIQKLDKQTIHRDAHPENMIFKDGEWKGFIDFDLCRKAPKVFDLSYILTGLLIGDFERESSRKQWLNLIPIMISGYEEYNGLSQNEKNSMWYIFLSIQLICIAYFFDINNNDLADQNLDAFYWIYNSKSMIQEKIE